ncbi:putative S-layer protein [Candidatus Woesearchaeota archaeon]|jgi:hypothetical protein|nr:putative S-layer protein [Candidatus Woesearchaeota archaeon]MBT6044873.1 putative S-layer protein [Candidatus Woesearchaeota archaeon]
MFKKIIFTLALFMLMLVPAINASVADISFDPDPVSLDLLQGDSRDFDITITNSHLTDNITLSFTYDSMEDNDGDELLLNFPSEITIPANSNTTLTVNADVDHRLDKDTYTSTITFTDTNTSETKTLDFSAQVTIGICDFGPSGTSLQVKIKEPDSGDDYKPGEIIDIEVDVDNIGTETIRTQVEAYLYDEDEVIESTSSSTENIEEGEDETFYLSIKIPTDSRNINEDEDYTLYVKAFDDDHEEEECIQESLSVDIKLDKHDIIIEESTRLLPSTAFCGESVSLMVDVTNIGEKDEDVIISIENSALNIFETSDSFEVENFDSDNDNEGSRTFRFDVPEDASEGTYDFKVKASFSGDYSSTTLPLTVASCELAIAPAGRFDFATSNLFFKSEQSLDLNPSETSTIHLLIENNAPERRVFFINIDAVGFAETISSTATLEAFTSTNVFLPLTIFPDAEEGTYSATVELSDGLNTLTSETLTVQIGASNQVEETSGSPFSGASNASLMMAILILLLLIIGVILLIKQI